MPDPLSIATLASTVLETPIGRLRVDSDGTAVVRVAWQGDKDLRPPSNGDDLCHLAAEQLSAYFAGGLEVFDVPVKVIATPFVLQVCDAMSQIPHGAVRTYGDLARDLNSAARAVGGACGRNPIPIIIPCHRVMGASGRLTGFSGGEGVNTKRFLLDLEQPQPRLL